MNWFGVRFDETKQRVLSMHIAERICSDAHGSVLTCGIARGSLREASRHDVEFLVRKVGADIADQNRHPQIGKNHWCPCRDSNPEPVRL